MSAPGGTAERELARGFLVELLMFGWPQSKSKEAVPDRQRNRSHTHYAKGTTSASVEFFLETFRRSRVRVVEG